MIWTVRRYPWPPWDSPGTEVWKFVFATEEVNGTVLVNDDIIRNDFDKLKEIMGGMERSLKRAIKKLSKNKEN